MVKNFLAGLGVGLVAPVFELVCSLLITTGLLVLDILTSIFNNTITSNVIALSPKIIGVIVVIDIIRNLGIIFFLNKYAIGNMFGNIFGLIIFYRAISMISPESANSSLICTVAMFISFILGLVFTIYKRKRDEDSDQIYSGSSLF